MNLSFSACAICALAAFGLAAPSQGQAEVPPEIVTGRILPGWRTADGTYMTAVYLQLAPGWKTYWRSPGEAGIPPIFDWSGSVNVGDVQLHWPRPDVFLTSGMQTIGYHDELVLPIEIAPAVPGQPVRVSVQVDLGVCLDICVPATVNLELDLPETGGENGAILQALADQPGPAREAGLAAHSCAVEPISDGLRVTATLALPALGGAETVVLENTRSDIWISESVTTRQGGNLIATVDMVGASGEPFVLQRDQILVTVLAGNRAVQVQGCPQG